MKRALILLAILALSVYAQTKTYVIPVWDYTANAGKGGYIWLEPDSATLAVVASKTLAVKPPPSPMGINAVWSDASFLTGISASTSGTSLTVKWTTAQSSNCQVIFMDGSDRKPSTRTPAEGTLATSHSHTFAGLVQGKAYSIKIASQSSDGVVHFSSDFSIALP